MLVVQLFVMKDGAFQGVEMAAGSRIVVGPPTGDVPLAGAGDDGVVLTLRDGTLVAETFGGARVNGRASMNDEVAPSHDVSIGAYAIKVRRMSAPPKTTQQSAPAFVDTSAIDSLAVTAPAIPTHMAVPELLAMGDTLPEPDAPAPSLAFLAVDPSSFDDDERDELAADVDWSLVEQLARPPEGTGDLVEVIHAQGELVLMHALLAAREAFDHGEHALVTRSAEGCRIDLPPGALARTRRGGALGEIMAGDQPLTLSLARGDAATLSIDGAVILVRFARRPDLAWSADDLRAQRFERKAHALCVSAGVSFCSLWAVALWIAEFRAREVEVALPDDITRWPEVEHMLRPPPEPVVPAERLAPEPEPKPVQEPSSSKPASAPKSPARGGSAKEAAGPLDVLKSLPSIPTSSPSWDEALRNMRQPIPGRPGGPKLTGLIGKGPRGETSMGGDGLNTGVSSKRLHGTGALEKQGERDIGGNVDRAKLGKLRTPAEAGLSKDDILRVINQHIGEIQYCYEKGLRGDASLGGRVVVEWTIGVNGRVTNARNETSTLAGNSVEDCMLRQIKTWTFPKANKPSAVVYPFSFSAL